MASRLLLLLALCGCRETLTFSPRALPASRTVLRAKGFGSEPAPSNPPPKRKAAAPSSGPQAAPEINLSSLGGASGGAKDPAEGLPPALNTEGMSEEEIFRKYGVATPSVKRRKRRKMVEEDFAKRTQEIEEAPRPNLVTQLPPDVQQGIERVLIAGLGLLGTAFVLGGILITGDAFLTASGRGVPEDIAETLLKVENAFTPTLIALFANSIVLGVFKLQQFDAPAAQYSEPVAKDDGGAPKGPL